MTAEQRAGTKLVDVTYDVTDPDGNPMSVSLWFSEDGGATFPIRCVTVVGDVNEGITNGTGKQIVWDAGADYPGYEGSNYVVRVTANDGQIPGGYVEVPAGSFTMGDGVAYCGVDERLVTLTNSFYLGQTEVTNQQYMDALQWAYDHGYVTATTSTVQDNLDGSTVELVDLDNSSCEISFSGGAFTVDSGKEDHPMKQVLWYGAVRYCDWLSLQAGLPRAYDHSGDWSCNSGNPYGATGYRLPTDAEWEYAAQYDDERIYPWGNESPDCSRANYRGGDPYCVGWTSPVGSYPAAPAALDLYDMAGNVWDWCNDWHTCNLGTSTETDPTGPGSGSSRVLRGGGWGGDDYALRCSGRYYAYPSYTSDYYGFRCARSH